MKTHLCPSTNGQVITVATSHEYEKVDNIEVGNDNDDYDTIITCCAHSQDNATSHLLTLGYADVLQDL